MRSQRATTYICYWTTGSSATSTFATATKRRLCLRAHGTVATGPCHLRSFFASSPIHSSGRCEGPRACQVVGTFAGSSRTRRDPMLFILVDWCCSDRSAVTRYVYSPLGGEVSSSLSSPRSRSMAFAAAHVAAYPSASRVASAVAAMVGHVLSRSSQVATISPQSQRRLMQCFYESVSIFLRDVVGMCKHVLAPTPPCQLRTRRARHAIVRTASTPLGAHCRNFEEFRIT